MEFLFLIITSAGANTLLMPASARGMLTYYSRSIGDEAIFYNPAIFTAQDDYHVTLFYTKVYASMRNLNLGLSKRFKDFDLGLNIMNFDYGEIEARPEYPTEDSTGFYTGSDFSIGICGARNISTNGRIGIKAKYIYENLYIYSGGTLGIDLSIAYINEKSGLTAGGSNLGGQIKIGNEPINLPAKLSLGYYHSIKEFCISFDLHYLINTNTFESSVGGEVKWGNNLETGISINYRDHFYPGFYLGISNGKISIKYGSAIYPYDLGMVNTLGIGFIF
uniref:PorV/PorQ family protein n=1 Tax=candidate division WOR-3 bacterium TaxID=2052148 RepID=A0A7V3RIS7_UNCW3